MNLTERKKMIIISCLKDCAVGLIREIRGNILRKNLSTIAREIFILKKSKIEKTY